MHAFASALLVRNTSVEFGTEISTAHESESPPDALMTKMDLHNNRFGRALAMKFPTSTDYELLTIIMSQKFFLVSPGDPMPNNLDVLVYLRLQDPFDGTFTGTITNPDSGGPWNASFDVNQCGSVLRGQYTVSRGSTTQQRRFTGTIGVNNTIVLNVSNPYSYENPNGLYFCSGMKMILTGTSSSLSGNWTSSDCTQGGTVSISK